MEDERDAEDAIRGLDKTEFGRQRRCLTVEWTKSDTGLKPAKTLFVIQTILESGILKGILSLICCTVMKNAVTGMQCIYV